MECDRAGNFKVEIIEYGMKEFPTGSVAVQIKASLKEIWDHDNEQWMPWEEYDMEAYGSVFVVKKDGTLNESGIRSLVNNAGWNGDFEAIANRTWAPSICQASIKAEPYEGKTYYKIAFINHRDSTPGSMGMLDDDKIKALNSRFGSSLRAMAGTVKANPAPAKGKPPAPPMSKKHSAAVNAQAPVGVAADDDRAPIIDPETGKEVPF